VAEVVLAALSASATRVPTLGFAKLFARMCDATPCAMHVRDSDDANAVGELTTEQDIDFRLEDGDPVTRIARAAENPPAKLVVVGSHRARSGRGPGFVTRAIATRVRQPLVVIPPEAIVPPSLERVLFPLEGTSATTAPICALLDQLAFDPDTNLVAVHSYAPGQAPRFADHEPYDTEDQRNAFAPHLPVGFTGGLVFRAGLPERTVPEEAISLGATLTVVSWSQVFAPGRAALVTTLLSDLTHPTLLIPSDYGASVSEPRDAERALATATHSCPNAPETLRSRARYGGGL
jgi:hypothetical protein